MDVILIKMIMKKERKKHESIFYKIRHGIFIYGISNRLSKMGIEFTPYYWEKEYVKDCEIPEINGNAKEYSVRELNEDDIKWICSIGDGYRLNQKLEQLKNGQICLGLIHNDRIVAYSWIELNYLKFRKLDIVFRKNECYLGGMHTIESYRGKNLAAYLRYAVYEKLKNNNRNTIYSISDYFNKPAIKFKQKLNSQHLKLYLFVNLFDKYQYNILLKTYLKG